MGWFRRFEADFEVLDQEEAILFFHPNLDRKVSMIETKHLMDITDFDGDGSLSQPLGAGNWRFC